MHQYELNYDLLITADNLSHLSTTSEYCIERAYAWYMYGNGVNLVKAQVYTTGHVAASEIQHLTEIN